MKRYLLDTNHLSAYLDRQPVLEQKIDRLLRRLVPISVQTVGELAERTASHLARQVPSKARRRCARRRRLDPSMNDECIWAQLLMLNLQQESV